MKYFKYRYIFVSINRYKDFHVQIKSTICRLQTTKQCYITISTAHLFALTIFVSAFPRSFSALFVRRSASGNQSGEPLSMMDVIQKTERLPFLRLSDKTPYIFPKVFQRLIIPIQGCSSYLMNYLRCNPNWLFVWLEILFSEMICQRCDKVYCDSICR